MLALAKEFIMKVSLMKIFTLGFLMICQVFADNHEQSIINDSVETDFFAGFEQRILECDNHFNIRPFLTIALSSDQENEENLDEILTIEVLEDLKSIFSTGRIVLSEAEQRDPHVVMCATFVEGFLTGGVLSKAFIFMKETTTEIMSEAIAEFGGTIAHSIGLAIIESLSQRMTENFDLNDNGSVEDIE